MPVHASKSRKKIPASKEWLNKFKNAISSPSEWPTLIKDLLFNSNYNFYFMLILMPVELILNIFIVYKIPYTEIDWVAYMSEVEGFVNGTYNYYELKGDTGPLVYPAGFVYIFTLFYAVTSRGINIKLAQYIFIGIYLTFMGIVFGLYSKTKRVRRNFMTLIKMTIFFKFI